MNVPTRSEELFARALRALPGGVNSPVRAFKSVGGTPRFIARGEGARVFDVDGNAYVDLVMAWGPLILGHAPPEVIKSVAASLIRGTAYGAPTEGEVELAELVAEAIPSIESLRLVCSGTEATMSAIRLARAATARNAIVKLEGCYHGHADGLLVEAGSGAATFGVPSSPGVPGAIASLTATAPYNDVTAVARLFDRAETTGGVAAIIVEPVAGNMGVVLPEPGWLAGLRRLCDERGALLIFDEVITGFRVGWGGEQGRSGVKPDLTCLGKVLGGGFPIGAYGGRRDLMERMAPAGPVYQAGTLAGNPVAVAAGLATLRGLRARGEDGYRALEERTEAIARALEEEARKAGVPLVVNRTASMLTPFFCEGPVRDMASAAKSDKARYARFFHAMLARGVMLPPSHLEAAFLSHAHGEEEIAHVVGAAHEALLEVAKAG